MSPGSNLRAAAVALVCAVALAPTTARAADDERGSMVSLQSGGYSPVADLTEDGTASFKTGFVVGGGVGYRFNRYLALRGSLNCARTEAEAAGRTPRNAIDGVDVVTRVARAQAGPAAPSGAARRAREDAIRR